MRAPLGRWLLAAAALGWLGCGRLGAPPLELAYRESLIGAGKVVQITNQGDEPLRGLEVRVETPAGEVKHHQVASLAAGETTEVGWVKLEGFEIPAGSRVAVHCPGYLWPRRLRIPSPAGTEPAPPGG